MADATEGQWRAITCLRPAAAASFSATSKQQPVFRAAV
jgi:hypothetical protein